MLKIYLHNKIFQYFDKKMLKFSGFIIWRLGSRNSLRKYSAPGVSVFKTVKTDSSGDISDKNLRTPTLGNKETPNLVAAAFASLNAPDDEATKKPSMKSIKPSRNQQLDNQIVNASDVNGLLLVAENPVVSRRHALKMVSVLSEWSSTNKVKLSDFEKDPRFLKLCRILGRSPVSQAMSSLTMAEDLSTVLGITGDDEAARLIANLSLQQMIKVMKALQHKGRRSTPLLRALSYNITKQPEPIDLKRSADLLFSMAGLNFPDPVLLDRICSDIIENLPSNKEKPAVVNSIMVSLGLLKYRHEAVLSAITDWMQQCKAVCRPGDVASAVVTLATVDYLPVQSDSLLETALSLKEDEMVKASSWLDLVFSLLILDLAQEHHLTSTLKPEFIDKLLSAGDYVGQKVSDFRLLKYWLNARKNLAGRNIQIPIPSRRKLMTIDAYVGLKFPSSSSRLPEDISVGVPIVYTKEKAFYVQSIMDTFKSLVSAETFLKKECQSGMGFIYDAEFAVDSRCHPVPLDRAATRKDVHRIAVLGLDYHDMARKVPQPLGVNKLYSRLLQLKGFKVLEIPYTEFNAKDKLVTRVQYIEKRLKDLVSQSNVARTS